MDISKEDIITNLRAIIISSKGGLKINEVRADYKETFGTDIPLKILGWNTLEEFFKNNSQNFSVVGNQVQAVSKPSSLHLVSLIERQRTSRKKVRSKLFSRQVHKICKPKKLVNDALSNVNKKNCSSAGPKISRQNNVKDNFFTPLKTTEQIHQTSKTKKGMNIDNFKISQFAYKGKDDSLQIHNQIKNSQELKGLKRTVVNDNISNAKESISATNISDQKIQKNDDDKAYYKESVPFEDFEDLQISKRTPSRLLNLKDAFIKRPGLINNDYKATFNEKHYTETSSLKSPFQRSLANISREEIVSAKRSVKFQLNVKDEKPMTEMNKKGYNELITDLEDNAKYELKLKQFCLQKGIILPVYSVIIREPKNHPKCYGCKLNIGDSFDVSTYPVETHSEITARELASKKAYNQLISNSNLPKNLFETEYVIKLRELCMQKYLPDPIFKSVECHPKNEPSYFICKVRIGSDILLSSYPIEVHDEFSARDIAAKKAYDYLFSRSKSPSGIAINESTILSQIYNIVKSKDYGVWSNKLPVLYMEEHHEELRLDWFSLVRNSSKFEITEIEKVGHIIRVKTDCTVSSESEESLVMTTLKLPESNQWEVYITNVISSAEIWCRLIGKEYSEVYDTMMTKLELQPPTVNVLNPKIGKFYLVNLEESWNRVKVMHNFERKNEVSVFLIDVGVDEVVKTSQLFYLNKTFFSVPPQAILLSLNELDFLAECEELQSALFHSLLGSTFIAEVVAILDAGKNVSSVNLWDTSTDEDVNMNLKLLDDVIKTIKSPVLPTIGLVKEMFISHIDDMGNVYVQNSEQSAEYVEYIISTKIKNSGSLVLVKNTVDPKKLYVTRCSKTGSYYRAKLVKVLDATNVTLKFIDYGYEEQAAIDDLYDLEETSLDLATIPCQVIRVKLANLKIFNNKILAKIREYVLRQNVLVKVTEIATGGISAVELFKRSEMDGTLSSINNKIIADKQLQMIDSSVRKKSYVVGLENTLSKNLPMPKIPPIGSYFNVFVTLAAHPGLFNVQPLTTHNELMQLMFRLQEKCEGSFSKPLTQEEFKIGELYAVKHADDFWYRAYAHAIISTSAFTVCLCDFGDFIIVPAEKLMPLPCEFKTFPYQAIRAHLAGISPADKDWSAVDCVKFRELVVEKQFVSRVIEINRDIKNPNYISLGLILVDTSTSEDIYIHQILVDSNMAVLKK